MNRLAPIVAVLAVLSAASSAAAQAAPVYAFDPATIVVLLNGIKTHAAAAVVASILALIVLAAHWVESIKTIWGKLGPKARLFWPIGITIVSAVVDALGSGKPWLNSLLAAVLMNGYAILYIATSPAEPKSAVPQ